MMTSLLSPSRLGRRCILSGFAPAMQAAVALVIAAAAARGMAVHSARRPLDLRRLRRVSVSEFAALAIRAPLVQVLAFRSIASEDESYAGKQERCKAEETTRVRSPALGVSCFFRRTLENNLGSELNVAVVGGCGSDIAKGAGVPSGARISKVWVIENIEHLGPELELKTLLDGEVFEDREIGIHQAWPVENVPARAAESPGRGKGKCCRVDAVRYVARTAIFCGDSNNIGTLISAADMRLVQTNQDVEWLARLRGKDRVGLPVSQRPAQEGVLSIRRRQVIDHAGDKTMPDIPVGIAIIAVPIKGIHGRATAVRIRGNVDRVGPRVARKNLHAVTHPLPED